MHFEEMMPRLGSKQGLEVEITSLPRQDYRKDDYLRSGLPLAPAIMVDDEVVVQGADVSEDSLQALLPARLR